MILHESFLRQSRERPEHVAIEFGKTSISYGEAADRTARLAIGLKDRAGSGGRVAIQMAKSPDAILTMLGCLRAGLPYIPMDPASPPLRRVAILHDSEATLLIVDPIRLPQRSADHGGVPIALVGDLLSGGGRGPLDATGDDHMAYALYTSGSTGTPKGVVITHRNACSFVRWAVDYAELSAGDRVAVHAPLHFDLPVLDIFASLSVGATICPADERTTLFPQALLNFTNEQAVTVLYAVPSALVGLLHRSTIARDGIPSLRLLLYAGEEFHPRSLRSLMDLLPGVAVHNLYGPTETNVVTAQRVGEEELALARIPIGRPVPGTQVVLCGDDGQVVREPGRRGEILVSGPTVSPGYLNRPELTAQTRCRMRQPFGWLDYYRTGDLARWNADGVLHFLGRRDGLVKTRGFRVELGEVEAALQSHEGVMEAAVVAQPHPEHTNVLHGFVVRSTGSSVTVSELIDWCRRMLPGYMVPSQLWLEKDLPRTSTGKIDKHFLQARGLRPRAPASETD